MEDQLKTKLKAFHETLTSLFVRGSDYAPDLIKNDYSAIKNELTNSKKIFSSSLTELIKQLPSPNEFKVSIEKIDKAIKVRSYGRMLLLVTISLPLIYWGLINFNTPTFKSFCYLIFIASALTSGWLFNLYYRKFRIHFRKIADVKELIMMLYFELKSTSNKY